MVDATLLIEHVTLIDGTGRGGQANMAVAVNGTDVVAVGPSGRVRVPASAARVDGTGQFLVPGLWDNHVHLEAYGSRSFPLFLANGVTTVREAGGSFVLADSLRRLVAAGRIPGPRLLVAGPILDSPEMVAAMPDGRAAVATPADAVRWVDSLASLGVDHVKVHSFTPRSAYFAVLTQAARRGISVIGHVPDSVTVREAIDAGHRTIEHEWRIAFANSPAGPALAARLLEDHERARARGSAGRQGLIQLWRIRHRAEDSTRQLHDSATAAHFAEWAAPQDVWFTPTLVAINTDFRKNEPAMRRLPELRFAPAAALALDDGVPADSVGNPEAIAAGRARYRAVVTRTFGSLVRAQARFLAGTDAPIMPLVPGFSLHRELELLVEMGLTPLQALQAATRNGAEAARRDDLGTVQPGKVADLLLLRANPLDDISNTRAIESVVVRGRLLTRMALDSLLREAERFANQP